MAEAEPVELDEVEVKAVTGKAVLIEYDGGEHWIPLSQIVLEETDVKFERRAFGRMTISRWIAEQEKLT